MFKGNSIRFDFREYQ